METNLEEKQLGFISKLVNKKWDMKTISTV